jgi:hypothetical protein
MALRFVMLEKIIMMTWSQTLRCHGLRIYSAKENNHDDDELNSLSLKAPAMRKNAMTMSSVHRHHDFGSSHSEKQNKGSGLYNVGLWKLKV